MLIPDSYNSVDFTASLTINKDLSDVKDKLINAIRDDLILDDIEDDIRYAIEVEFGYDNKDVAETFADNILTKIADTNAEELVSYMEFDKNIDLANASSNALTSNIVTADVEFSFDLSRFIMDKTAE